MNEHIRIKAVLEIAGKPKDYIEQKMKDYIENIRKSEGMMVMEEKIHPAMEQKGFWSTIAEVDVVFDQFAKLLIFCIDFMPASIDIIKPLEFHFPERQFTHFMNDVLAKLHGVDILVKKANSENAFLKRNLSAMAQNLILVCLKFGINSPGRLATATGMTEKDLQPILDLLLKEKKIKVGNGAYALP